MDTEKKKSRISSIDSLRGLVMLLMLVDHVRERFFYHVPISDPLNIDEVSVGLFFTRFSAHFCAPVFVFLTGLSAWLYAHPEGRPLRSPSAFLFKRGIFLVFLELTLINFSWFGNYRTVYLQVIWAIGLSMISLSLLSKLPRIWVGILGGIIVVGHNLLTPISFEPGDTGYVIWAILHDRGYLLLLDTIRIKASYPVLPWIGVISLGYFAGMLYTPSGSVLQRQRNLLIIGGLCFLLLIIIRGLNVYGETLPWRVQDTFVMSIMSFLNYTKYPPSLDFLLITLGLGFVLLSFFERVKCIWLDALKVLGGAPMFFYVLHLYVLLIAYKVILFFFGPNTDSGYFSVHHLYQVWLIASLLSMLLYFPTEAFADFKKRSSLPWVKYF